MSTLLINANQPEEIRVALLTQIEENGLKQLWNLYIENTLKKVSLKNIYAGIVRSIEPSLEAAFIEYGPGRHGFLPFKEVAPSYFPGPDCQNIKTALKVGQTIMVQIKKEEQGTKGAALTTYITLPGSYLVLMPNHPEGGGISRRIEGSERREMYHVLSQLAIPETMGLILRTAGVGRDLESLQTDLTLLIRQWEAIIQAFHSKPAPFLIFQEGDIIVRAIRDYLREDIDEILVDDPKIFEKTRNYMAQIRPDLLTKLRLYQNPKPLFLQFGIEEEVELAFQPQLRLPSGGTIIFNRCEALVAIDINSSKSTQGATIEETAFRTNLEAAELIAKQLRLRDLGGIVVIDFIDMDKEVHKRLVENKLEDLIKLDKARTNLDPISSSFGLLAMSRQRLLPSLGKVNEDLCPYCLGQGIRRSIESLALAIIRTIEKQIFQKAVRQIRIELSIDLATYLSNEKRSQLAQLEKHHQLSILLLPNPYLKTARYKITTLSEDEMPITTHEQQASYTLLAEQIHEKMIMSKNLETLSTTHEVPAVQRFTQAPAIEIKYHKPRLWRRILTRLRSWLSEKRNTVPPKRFIDSIKQSSSGESRRRFPTGYRNRRSNSGGGNPNRGMRQTQIYSPNSTNNPQKEKQEYHRAAVSSRTTQSTTYRRAPNRLPRLQAQESPSPTPHENASTTPEMTFPPYSEAPTSSQTIIPLDNKPFATELQKASLPTKPLHTQGNTRRFGGEPRLRGRSYTSRTKTTSSSSSSGTT